MSSTKAKRASARAVAWAQHVIADAGGVRRPRSAWGIAAECADAGEPDRWFPDSNRTNRYTRSVAEATEICEGCPVRDLCLLDALATNEVLWAIRGGLLPAELQSLWTETCHRDGCGEVLPANRYGGTKYCSEACATIVRRELRHVYDTTARRRHAPADTEKVA